MTKFVNKPQTKKKLAKHDKINLTGNNIILLRDVGC